jgi:hypothetical protein
MKIGITGHQERPGIDWHWVRSTLQDELGVIGSKIDGLTSLAAGADQVFAQVVLQLGGTLLAVIPRNDYDTYFKGDALDQYRELLANAKSVFLHADDEQEAFLNAGLYVSDNSELLIAVWDGEPSHGKGGTADIVEHAVSKGKPWTHINPLKRTVVHHN